MRSFRCLFVPLGCVVLRFSWACRCFAVPRLARETLRNTFLELDKPLMPIDASERKEILSGPATQPLGEPVGRCRRDCSCVGFRDRTRFGLDHDCYRERCFLWPVGDGQLVMLTPDATCNSRMCCVGTHSGPLRAVRSIVLQP